MREARTPLSHLCTGPIQNSLQTVELDSVVLVQELERLGMTNWIAAYPVGEVNSVSQPLGELGPSTVYRAPVDAGQMVRFRKPLSMIAGRLLERTVWTGPH